MPTAIVELQEQLQAKSAELERILREAGPERDFSKSEILKGLADGQARVEEFRRRNAELDALGVKYDELAEIEAAEVRNQRRMKDLNAAGIQFVFPSGGSGQQDQQQLLVPKNLGQMVTADPIWQQGVKGAVPRFALDVPGVNLKATLSTGAGFAPANNRTNVVVDYAVRRLMVADLIPDDPTTLTAITIMVQTTFTNNAAGVTEGGAKPEGALGWTPQTFNVEVIAEWIPVTRQQLEDVAGMQSLINNNLTMHVLLAEEIYILNGSGTSPQIRGFLNTTGVQTQAKGALSVPDAIATGINKVRAIGFAEPSGIIMHPNDWLAVQLLTTADGIYLFGSPADATPERMWGKQVIVTTAMTENTALLGDFRLYSHISRREGITIDVSDSHADFFTRNLLAVRAEERMSLEVLRPSAFATVTGI